MVHKHKHSNGGDKLTEVRNSVVLTRTCTFCDTASAYVVHFRFPSVMENDEPRIMPLCNDHYDVSKNLPEIDDVPWYLS